MRLRRGLRDAACMGLAISAPMARATDCCLLGESLMLLEYVSEISSFQFVDCVGSTFRRFLL